MSNSQAGVQRHNPPNLLKAKLGGSLKAFDASAIARAEAAMAAMSDQFGGWLIEELGKLEAAHQATLSPAAGEKEFGDFYRCAHDLKGLGTTYGYPIISEFASSLCRLLDDPNARAKAPRDLLFGHVAAISAAVKQKITTSEHAIGAALLHELNDKVDLFSRAA